MRPARLAVAPKQRVFIGFEKKYGRFQLAAQRSENVRQLVQTRAFADVDHEGSYTPGPRDDAQMARNELLGGLMRKVGKVVSGAAKIAKGGLKLVGKGLAFVGKLALVGAGMRTNSGVSAQLFEALPFFRFFLNTFLYCAIVTAIILAVKVHAAPTGTDLMREIAAAEGSTCLYVLTLRLQRQEEANFKPKKQGGCDEESCRDGVGVYSAGYLSSIRQSGRA